MKKGTLSLAVVLAIAFATASAFSPKVTFTGYLADADNSATTDYPASPNFDETESDITVDVNSYSGAWSSYKTAACSTAGGNQTVCAIKVTNDSVDETVLGQFTEPL